MGKEKTNEPRFDSNGARMVMRKRDYFADLGRPVFTGSYGKPGRSAYLLFIRIR